MLWPKGDCGAADNPASGDAFAAPQHPTRTRPSGVTVMLFIGRPPQRESDRTRTSFSAVGALAAKARAGGVGRGAGTAAAGGNSDRARMSSGRGFGRSGSGTGARTACTAGPALRSATDDILAGCSASSLDAGGGLKIAALAVPATMTKARVRGTRFMDRTRLATR